MENRELKEVIDICTALLENRTLEDLGSNPALLTLSAVLNAIVQLKAARIIAKRLDKLANVQADYLQDSLYAVQNAVKPKKIN